MSSHSLKENSTHVSNFKGRIRGLTSNPEDSGVAGLREGDVYYNTDDNKLFIYASDAWYASAAWT